jgi:hypothetical protein
VGDDDEGAHHQARAAQAGYGAAYDQGCAVWSEGANQRAELKDADRREKGKLDGEV